ncbi:MAG: metallophosphoesterase [Treponema sp.]|jgi:predicted MPP superfamily phosphohydrolase|nr:metallophosphoesterase [Treponema sp.]
MLWLFRSLLVLFIYTGLSIYIGFRLFAFGKLLRPSLKHRFFWPIYALLTYSFILIVLFRLDRIMVIRITAMYWPAFFAYLFLFIFLFDFIALILFIFRKITFRRTFRLMPVGSGAALCLTVLLLLYGSFHARDIRTISYQLSFSAGNTGEKLRIVLVSDLHIGPTVGKKWTARIVDRINNASPDLVCMAGDIFDSGLEGIIDREAIATELRRINAPLGVYACPGNHDTNRRTRSLEEIAHFLLDSGVTLLLDELVQIKTEKTLIIMAGRRDARPIGMDSRRLTLEELTTPVTGILENPADAPGKDVERSLKPLVILLEHQPLELPQAAELGIDLVLSGHTHGGQFFPGNLFTRAIFKNYGAVDYGHWQTGNTQAVISSGAGVWGPPIRIGTNSEIVLLEILF